MGTVFALVACGGGGDSGPVTPPAATYTVGVTAVSLGTGESFTFSMGSGQTVTVTQAGVSVKFAQALSNGAAYTVTQTAGPRTCTLSANRSGTITSANVDVSATCAAVPTGTPLAGMVRGPIGAQPVLQINGAGSFPVTVVAAAGSTDHYDETAFSLATTLATGAAYQLSVKTVPAGQTCAVYKGAAGTLPAAGSVGVGCEFTYDLVSRSSNDSAHGTYYDSGSAPVIGGANVAVGSTTTPYGEGRFIAFSSSATGLDGVGNGFSQIYWRDQLSGETRLVSATATGVPGSDSSYAPAISADGLTVVFESYASNLVAGDTNNVSDIFLWSAADPTNLKRVSVSAAGVQANAASYQAAISGDGSVVAFVSGASNLTAGVSGINTINVYRRNLGTGATKLITANSAGQSVGGEHPALSEDGNRLAFYSFSSEIVSGDTNLLWDIFVYDATTGAKQRVSLTSTGAERDQGSESSSRVVAPAISGNGRYVAYATTATNMVPGDTNGLQDVFVVDTQTGAVVRVSVGSNGTQGNADSPIGQGERVSLSYDGTWVAFSTGANNLGAGGSNTGIGNVLMHNRVTGETRAVTNQNVGSVGEAAMSRSGAYVLFGSSFELDPRFGNATGLFSRFTGVARAWSWID